jgi:integrase
MTNKLEFTSILADFIVKYLEEKRSLGYVYDTESLILKRFDKYCNKKELNTFIISKEFLESWMIRSNTEGATYQTKRISVVRGLLLYMNAFGHESYIPHHFSKIDVHIPYILRRDEVIAFFETLDSYKTLKRHQRFLNEYKVLFRVIYCCGLRNSEACNLKMSNVNLTEGKLSIEQSKNQKDRIVYLSDDLIDLCKNYKAYITKFLAFEPDYFFPSSDVNKPFSNTSINGKFKDIWCKTVYSKLCDKNPTVQGLRHSFVVHRMNLWMEDGININNMLPYLCKYLGHKSINETFYYYHQTEEAFRIIAQKDTISKLVIPEVHDE